MTDGYASLPKTKELLCAAGVDNHFSEPQQDNMDSHHLYELLEQKVLPIFYENETQLNDIIFNAINDVVP